MESLHTLEKSIYWGKIKVIVNVVVCSLKYALNLHSLYTVFLCV